MTTQALAVVDEGPLSMQVFDAMCEQAAALISSGFLPQHIRTPEQAVAIRLMGRELGVPMMLSLRKIHVIQGTPACASELLLALARRTGEMEDFVLSDDGQKATCTVKRRGQTPHTTTFSMADAQAMGLIGKDNWKKQPQTMREWRAVAKNLRRTFADAIGGMYPLEEVAPDVEVDAQGSPVNVAALPGQPIQKSRAKSKAAETPTPASPEGAAQPPAAPSGPPARSAAQPSGAPASPAASAPTTGTATLQAAAPSPTTPSKFDAQIAVIEATAKTYQPPAPKPTPENPEPRKPDLKKYMVYKVVLNGETVEASCWDSEITKIVTAAMEAGIPVNATIEISAKGYRKILKAAAVEPEQGQEPDGAGDPEAA